MMGRLFDILAERDASITKEAFLGAAAKLIATNPLKTVGAVLTGQQVMADSKKMVGVGNTARNMTRAIQKAPSITY